MTSSQAIWHPRLRAFQIWGTHQGCGKTIAAIAMSLSIATKGRGPKGTFYNLSYSKPISIGPEHEDSKFLRIFRKWRGELGMPKYLHNKQMYHESAATNDVAMLGKGTPDSERGARYLDKNGQLNESSLLDALTEYAALQADYMPNARSLAPGTWMFVETLGGVDTRLASNTPQADLYSGLRLPGILVGDHSPGGFEKTVKAHDYLRMRGYDVQGALVFKEPAEQHQKLVNYFDEENVHCAILNAPPARHEDERKARNIFQDYCQGMGRSDSVKRLIKYLNERHKSRDKARLEDTETPEERAAAQLAIAAAPEIQAAAQQEHARMKAEKEAQRVKSSPTRNHRNHGESQRVGYENSRETTRTQSQRPPPRSYNAVRTPPRRDQSPASRSATDPRDRRPPPRDQARPRPRSQVTRPRGVVSAKGAGKGSASF